MTPLYIVTEDAISEAVVDRMVEIAGSDVEIVTRMGKQGSGYLRRKLPELSRLATKIPVLMVTDLDRKECAPVLLNDWTLGILPPPTFLLRIAVREVESWLLADRDAFSEFSRVPVHRLPQNPDRLVDPKRYLLNLVSRYSRRPLKRSLLPVPGSTGKVGITYNSELSQFIKKSWSPDRAAQNSDSLARAMRRLRDL